MKVVLFCGGHGMRTGLRIGDAVPKTLQMVGPRPLLWHTMRYYAHYGHKEFILCLGDGASHIKDYFLTYQESASNNFVMRGTSVDLMQSDTCDWSVTFVDTGLDSSLGERLQRIRPHLGGDRYFLANYADVLTDAPLDQMITGFHEFGATAAVMVVKPQQSFHCVEVSENGEIKQITPVADLSIRENGGYFVFSQEIFDVLQPGQDLVTGALQALARDRRLFGYQHHGFWHAADTFKERADLDAQYNRGDRPWMVWEDR
ncbi:MAG: glucose-phosphate cytidylyltransferase [Mycobacterium sp.]|nr:glucose-phosphate cytidylyltransferase [Mycobacterium sp.]